MSKIIFHPGRLPNDPNKPRALFGAHLTQTPTYPEVLDYISGISYPMYLNDREGDCTFAGAGHIIQAESHYGSGTTQTVTDNDVQTGYVAVSGYNPRTGANDNGCVMQDVLSYWRKTGIGGHKILAFAEVDINNKDELRAAMNTFGALYIGINFPDSAMDQFNEGKPWDVVRGAQIEGGHAIHGGAYKVGGNWQIVTWGAVQEMTDDFWDNYVEEAWVVITQEWLDANGHSPTGFDLYGLGEQLANLTGEPNPFPSPTPTPNPEPVPTPAPTPSDPDAVLESFLTDWFNKGYALPKHRHLYDALKQWLDSRS
jgi:hypothetical protein